MMSDMDIEIDAPGCADSSSSSSTVVPAVEPEMLLGIYHALFKYLQSDIAASELPVDLFPFLSTKLALIGVNSCRSDYLSNLFTALAGSAAALEKVRTVVDYSPCPVRFDDSDKLSFRHRSLNVVQARCFAPSIGIGLGLEWGPGLEMLEVASVRKNLGDTSWSLQANPAWGWKLSGVFIATELENGENDDEGDDGTFDRSSGRVDRDWCTRWTGYTTVADSRYGFERLEKEILLRKCLNSMIGTCCRCGLYFHYVSFCL